MRTLLSQAKRFVLEEDGATATEYAVMIALIILVCLSAISAMGEKVSGVFVLTEQEFSTYYP